MAAIVDRPLSAIGNGLEPIVPQRRRRESVEIIDVDSLDDDIVVPSRRTNAQPRPRPFQRRWRTPYHESETDGIIVLDSDEDGPVVGTSSGRHRAPRSRLFSPPPQPHQPSPVPPVPPVPPRYASHTSFPARRWPPPVYRPPVRPMHRPFDFEAYQNPRAPGPSVSRRPPRRSPPMHASAPSHHMPSMGLGGALISSYRENQRQANPQPGLLARAGAAAGGLANRLSRNLANVGPAFYTLAFNFGMHDGDDNEALARTLVETEMQQLFGDLNHRHLLRHLSRDRHPQSATYQTAYTHPVPVEPGFTYDFASELTPTTPEKPRHTAPIVIDEEERSSAPASKRVRRGSSTVSHKSSNVLVCALCLDPLVLSAGLVGEDLEQRRVWALRCGHMIDGKCLMEIGQPSNDATDEEATSKIITEEGKGKARASPRKGKGKGKAKVVDEDRMGLAPAANEHNSIRSRLRSSRTTGSASDLSMPSTPRKRQLRKQRIEGEYRYLCPVVGCGYIHVSVKVNGEWRPERDEDRKKPGGRRAIKFPDDLAVGVEGNVDIRGRGAIPVFA